MKTNLNRTIICTQDVIDYIKELVNNKEIYPLCYNAHYVIWIGETVTPEQRDRLNYLADRCDQFIKNPTKYAQEYMSLLDFVANEN